MTRYACPYLDGEVELTDEREAHIARQHPDLLPAHRDLITATLEAPDRVIRSRRMASAKLFSRWYNELSGGKHAVVVVVSDGGSAGRHWIITAYLARKLAEGEIEWQRG